jgi:N-acetylglucosaminyldiphosphoundecaprenol N-acetyl-beta-D-mannosaminyltransferase
MISSSKAVASIQELKPPDFGAPMPYNELRDTSLIGSLELNRLTMEEAVVPLLRHVRKVRREGAVGKAMHIFGVNAQVATLVQENKQFAAAMSTAGMMYPDGISLVLAGHLLGRPLKGRIPGGELMELLCKEGAKEGMSVYFLGGLPGAAEKTAQILEGRYPGLKIAGALCPPFNFEKDPAELAAVVKSIQDSAPDMLFVGLGVPKQEFWIANNSPVLPIGLAFPVGAAFDTTAGLRKRAPRWAQRTGTEWLYRLVMEPKRLWRRYLIGNTAFAMMVLTQWVRERGQRPLAAGD